MKSIGYLLIKGLKILVSPVRFWVWPPLKSFPETYLTSSQ